MRSAIRELQNEKLFPAVGFEPGTFRLRSELAKRLLVEISIDHLKVDRVLYKCAIKTYMYHAYHVEDVVKCFFVYYISLPPYSQQTSE